MALIETEYKYGEDGPRRDMLWGWGGVVWTFKHEDLKLCDSEEELHTPGVYFLFGEDNGKQLVYVGEAEDVLHRIPQKHIYDDWKEAVVVITPNGSLDKAKIKYLENCFHTIIAEAGRFVLKNGNIPPQSSLQSHFIEPLEDFIKKTKFVIRSAGWKVFEPIKKKEEDKFVEDGIVFYFSKKKGISGKGEGKKTKNGFMVLKGSYIYPEVAKYVPTVKKLREIHAKKIDSNNILIEDVEFGSSSTAASFISGKSINGLTDWKTKEGKTFGEVYEKEQA